MAETDMVAERERMNSDRAIELARPIAERWRGAIAVALKATGQGWRSPDLQVALLTGEIAAAIDAALAPAATPQTEKGE